MRNGVCVIDNLTLPSYDEREILRYAGVKDDADEGIASLLAECLAECDSAFTPRVCYCALPVAEFFDRFDQERRSQLLQNRLSGCDKVLLFAATVGLGADRLIRKYAATAPSKALVFQAIGAERIESLCDVFCQETATQYGETTARFSAGYGDFPLTAQKTFFTVLDCSKHIGVSLTDSLLMLPTKSVTAAVGIRTKA